MATNQARALYDFHPASEQEVGFSAGDIISHVEVVDENWWRGTTPNGSYGLFPCNYVERIEAAAAPAHVAAAPPPAQLNIAVRALWDYEGQTDTELSITKGDTFTVIEKDDEGVWWNGVYMSGGQEVKRGWFPASYVEEVSSTLASPVAAATTTTSPVAYSPAASSTSVYASAAPVPTPMPAVGGYGAMARTTIPIGNSQPAQPEFTIVVSPRHEPPPPQKEMKKEKIGKDTFAFLEVHVFECTGIPSPKKGAVVQIGLKEFGKARKVFQTATAKKAVTDPIWNESFQLNIVDPEETNLVVTLLDGKKVVGELDFPLRSSKRTQFEEVGGLENKWALQGKEASGTLHLIIKYRDVNAISKPAQFVKDQSITASGGAMVTSNLSPEWAKVLTAAVDQPPAQPPVQQQQQYAPVAAAAPTPVLAAAAPLTHQPVAPVAAAGYQQKPAPPAGFKPPPPAGPRPAALPGYSSAASGVRPPPPAGPRPAPRPGIGAASPVSVSSPQFARPSPASPAGFKPPPPAGPRPGQAPGFKPPPPAGPRPGVVSPRQQHHHHPPAPLPATPTAYQQQQQQQQGGYYDAQQYQGGNYNGAYGHQHTYQ